MVGKAKRNIVSMLDREKLFSEFDAISEEEWLEKIKSDLKGNPIEDLNWEVEEGIVIAPFSTDQINEHYATSLKNNNDWEIGEEITVTDPKLANAQALQALSGGTNAIRFRIPSIDSNQTGSSIFGIAQQLSTLLKDIQLDYISVHFDGNGFRQMPMEIITAFIEVTEARGNDLKKLRGGFALYPDQITDNIYSKLLGDQQSKLPLFLPFVIQESNSATISSSLAQLIFKGSDFLSTKILQKDLQKANSLLRFSFKLGKNYFVNIAKLRAFRLLWANVLDGYGLTIDKMPMMSCDIILDDLELDFNTQLIYATTQATAAVFAGIDLLTIIPIVADEHKETSSRLCRNIHHLMKMESYFDQVIDPVRGSYFIEQLTAQLAELAWTKFQNLANK